MIKAIGSLNSYNFLLKKNEYAILFWHVIFSSLVCQLLPVINFYWWGVLAKSKHLYNFDCIVFVLYIYIIIKMFCLNFYLARVCKERLFFNILHLFFKLIFLVIFKVSHTIISFLSILLVYYKKMEKYQFFRLVIISSISASRDID